MLHVNPPISVQLPTLLFLKEKREMEIRAVMFCPKNMSLRKKKTNHREIVTLRIC